MIIDSEDYKDLPQPSIEDLHRHMLQMGLRTGGSDQTTFLIDLPDELYTSCLGLPLASQQKQGSRELLTHMSPFPPTDH